MRYGIILGFCFLIISITAVSQESAFEVLILGTAQDGGYPQANCSKSCCTEVYESKNEGSYVTSLALIDKSSSKVWLFDCTPDFSKQLDLLSRHFDRKNYSIEAIFLTHAHIGHYLGLAQLGREVMGYKAMPIYAMPRMKRFLQNNGPWNQLVELNNIEIRGLNNNELIEINEDITVTPILVPHRDEYSETVGFSISSQNKSLLFIPDIDKWSKWDHDLTAQIQQNAYVLIDGTFYSEKELPGRSMKDIPHPSVLESMTVLNELPFEDKNKVYFIHMNHSNPLLRDTEERKSLKEKGFNVAKQGLVLEL